MKKSFFIASLLAVANFLMLNAHIAEAAMRTFRR
ncbi:hypothetical protein QFZ97_001104 [Paraburkholderia youngii]